MRIGEKYDEGTNNGTVPARTCPRAEIWEQPLLWEPLRQRLVGRPGCCINWLLWRPSLELPRIYVFLLIILLLFSRLVFVFILSLLCLGRGKRSNILYTVGENIDNLH